jgi:uncharacterized protein (TIGR02569 family)
MFTLTEDIINSFKAKGKPKQLVDGEGKSILVGDVVFKPIENAALYEWSCQILNAIETDGFRISKPLVNNEGKFIYKGWSASVFEPGEHVKGRWNEKLDVSRRFHKRLAGFSNNSIPGSKDRWSKAHEIAWQIDYLPENINSDIKETITALFKMYEDISYSNTIIHGDICGNVLFSNGLPPLIIDFSPSFKPIEYAESILISDAIAWENAPLDIIKLLPENQLYNQMFLRALNFRIIVAALFYPESSEKYFHEYSCFKELIRCTIERNHYKK